MILIQLIIYVLMIFSTKEAIAEGEQIEDRFLPLYLKSISTFQGDKHGDFKNDLVAILSDGSGWKVHPIDQEIFSSWNSPDIIHIRLRHSFYWFKREHQFELFNENSQNSVRVMLVQYPSQFLYVVNAKTYLANSEIAYYTVRDSNGKVNYVYYTKYIYHTKIELNNGSVWIVSKNDQYIKGDPIYLFIDYADQPAFIVVRGIEREAFWQKATREEIIPIKW